MVCGFDIYGMVIIFMMRFEYLWYGYNIYDAIWIFMVWLWYGYDVYGVTDHSVLGWCWI